MIMGLWKLLARYHSRLATCFGKDHNRSTTSVFTTLLKDAVLFIIGIADFDSEELPLSLIEADADFSSQVALKPRHFDVRDRAHCTCYGFELKRVHRPNYLLYNLTSLWLGGSFSDLSARSLFHSYDEGYVLPHWGARAMLFKLYYDMPVCMSMLWVHRR